ncbi:zinc knuckle CX2CX4HX4C containing protein [Tanacetum coccineum]
MSSDIRSSRRQKRVPLKFSDHVMENVSQKKNGVVVQGETEEIRAKLSVNQNKLGENDEGTNKEVFGNKDSSQNKVTIPEENAEVSPNTEINCNEYDDVTLNSNAKNDKCEGNNCNKENTSKGYATENKDSNKNETFVSMVRRDDIPKKLNYRLTETIESDSAGLNAVVDKGSWMVNNTPLFVQKWDHEIGMQKVEHNKIPVWVKLANVPLEAWSIEGISALASGLGKPLIMDNMTANMCYTGMGRLEFARVLVEMCADKDLKSQIEVQYRDKDNKVKGTKVVKVNYDWKPTVCTHCKVFGHDISGCKKR